MRSLLKSVSLLVTVAAVLVGCTSAEQKLGRGLDNLSEPFRLGELQRSYEQGALFGGEHGGTVGIVRGVNRTIGQTLKNGIYICLFSKRWIHFGMCSMHFDCFMCKHEMMWRYLT